MSTILIAEARFYPHLNDMLLDGARRAIEAAGHKHETITVPGAHHQLEIFELPLDLLRSGCGPCGHWPPPGD